MSGFAFQPVQVPDFGATLARAQGFGANQLIALQQMRQMETQDSRQNALSQFAPLLAERDPQKRMAALAGLARVMPEVALPMMQSLRDEMEWQGGGMPAASPTAPAAAAPVSTGQGGAVTPPPELMPFFQRASEATGIPVPVLVAQARQESNFDPNAVGRAGEIGIGQIKPSTAAAPGFGVEPVDPARLRDPGENIMFQARYLAGRGRAAGVTDWNDPQQVAKALAAYNGGGDPDYVRNVTRYLPGGDVTPASGTGGGGANSNLALPAIEGFDMATVRRALQMPNNRNAQAYLKSYYDALQGIPRETMPRSPERFQQDVQLAQTSAPRVTTNVTNAGDNETNKLVAQQWNDLEQAVTQSGRTNLLLERGARALESFQPGVFAEKRIWLGQVAREFGLRSNASEGEMLRAVQRQLEMAATPRGQGAITENERALIREQIPILTATPDGAREAMKMLRALNDYDAKIATIYRQNAARNGGRPDPVTVRQEVADFVNANPIPDATAAMSPYLSPEQVGAGSRDVPGPGGNGTASPPPNIPPPPGGGRIIMPGAR